MSLATWVWAVAAVCGVMGGRGTAQRPPIGDSGDFPGVINLATGADISANATCGARGLERYCRLVEHVRRRPGDTIQCGLCDQSSADPHELHPIKYAIDGTNRWWQSPSITNGHEYHYVSITLDLKQVYQVAYVFVKAANSPRPGNWVLEKSIDGVTYQPWQYFAVSDSECWNLYNVAPTVGIPRYKTDDEVICTSYFSRLDPLTHGEIHVSLVTGRPGVDGPSPMLMDFTRARYIRLRLEKIRTLNADLMTFIYHDIHHIDPTVTNRYFYSIKDISVGGQCICYGHAKACPMDPNTGALKCECEGNTCGATCSSCCPLYNQQQWTPGSYTDKAHCQECNCYSHAHECVFNATIAENQLSLNPDGIYEGGGVCVDCQHNTMGVNCELCADGYYRPSGVDVRAEDACHLCLCVGPGATGFCVKDDSMIEHSTYPGDCICREGYCGPRCEECVPGYRGYPLCEPCPCHHAGSVNIDTCEGECICKAHVCGDHCDDCLPGYFNLQIENPNGCDACFCFHITDQCHSLNWPTKQMTELGGWSVTDLSGSGTVVPTRNPTGSLTLSTHNALHLNRAIYWKAPALFIGDKVPSYGGTLQYVFRYSVNDSVSSPDSYLANDDIILEGSGMRLAYGGQYHQEDARHVVMVILTEDQWLHADGSTSPRGALVPKEEFMVVLGRIDRLLLRAAYHIQQADIRLLEVSLDVVSRTGTGPVLPSVEQCICPMGYAGSSCELCAPGYRRVGNILLGGTCEPCNCNNHAPRCDPFTGECLDCQHHTQGAYCELCNLGYYGDATLWVDGCRPCACPLPEPGNNFAPTCMEVHHSINEFVCVGCFDGYEGEFCEICSASYYGNPMLPGSSCQQCDCHGNSMGGTEPCDRLSGVCRGCAPPTEGLHCERCAAGYWGSAREGDCSECACSPVGAVGGACDRISGQCQCREGYTGRDCGRCLEGFGNIAQGCLICNCSPEGSLSTTCDTVTGQCPCRPGVGGYGCTYCNPGFYRFSIDGCDACACDKAGAHSSECDALTGRCECRPLVEGRRCDRCQAGYWDLGSGQGCQHCACDAIGAMSDQCDPVSGQCRCKPGVGGQFCENCQVGYFGFMEQGCLECAPCRVEGQVCDADTGQCICPHNTEGEWCERCVAEHWGHDPLTGCKPCGCHNFGTVTGSKECDPQSGACTCRGNFRGMQCNKCPQAYWDFPFCAPCDCNREGTEDTACEGELCQCNAAGECPCKANVEGSRCTTCALETFSLSRRGPSGCTGCFCFGRSTDCTQAILGWKLVGIKGQSATLSLSNTPPSVPTRQEYVTLPVDDPQVQLHPDQLNKPLYWSLTDQLHGDQTLSYNGRLLFTLSNTLPGVINQAGDLANTSWPLLQLVGNFRVRLQYAGLQGPAPGESRQYEVLLSEGLWVDPSGRAADRTLMMVALQQVQQILVKAVDHVFISDQQLREVAVNGEAQLGTISLTDVILERAVSGQQFDGSRAVGVEQCVCPHEYVGLSCQDPAVGFYRLRPDDIMERPNVIEVIGESVLCNCHHHSSSCHQESSVCQDCQHNTVGDHCNVCAHGYYGDATLGSSTDCQPCACPLVGYYNNFSPTCHAVAGGDYVCDACLPGYSGDKCQYCIPGYYGDPMAVGSSCAPCGCSEDGSLSQDCEQDSGQCRCHSGITGQQCDRCEPRHAIVDNQCHSCTVGCPGILFDSVDYMWRVVNNFNTSAAALLPWSRLSKLSTDTMALNSTLQVASLVSLGPEHGQVRGLQDEARKLNTKVNNLPKVAPQTAQVLQEATAQATDITDTLGHIQEVVSELQRVVEKISEGAGGLPNLEGALAEAEAILQKLRVINYDNILQDVAEKNSEAEGQAAQMQRLMERYSGYTDSMKTMITDAESQLKSLLASARAATRQSTNTDHLTAQNIRTLADIKNELETTRRKYNYVEETLHSLAASNEDATSILWNNASNNYQMSMQLLSELREAGSQVAIKTNMVHQGLLDLEPVVPPAMEHARYLNQSAEALERTFAGTRLAAENPLRAAEVYKQIADAVTDAQDAAINATAAADKANTAIQSSPGRPLDEQVQDALAKSKNTHDDSILHLRSAEGLGRRQDDVKQKLTETEASLEEISGLLGPMKDVLYNSTSDVSEWFEDVNTRAVAALGALQRGTNLANTVEDSLVKTLRPQLQEVQNFRLGEIQQAARSVNAVKNKLDDILNMTELLEEKDLRIKKVEEDISATVQQLKEKIRQARQLAKNVRVSLYNPGSCVRRYESPSQPSTSDTVELYFKTNNTRSNMLLFLLHNPQNGEFLSLELQQGKVRMTFNLGGGIVTVQHHLEVMSSKGAKDEQSMWYKVRADRLGTMGKLLVKKLASSDPPQPLTIEGSSTYSTLDMDSGSNLFIGGVPSTYQLPVGVISREFEGCMDEVHLDGHKVGLYNFRELDGTGCDGCHLMPDNIGTDAAQQPYHFDGNGYSSLPQAPYLDNRYIINLQFKSHWEDALLYFTHNNHTGDFISLELVGGKVVYRFGQRDGRQAIIQSDNKYNINKWVTVNAGRDGSSRQALLTLTVDGAQEQINQGLPPGVGGQLDLAASRVYLAGVPSFMNLESYNVTQLGFLGCIKSVTLSSRGAQIQDLLNGIPVGMQLGCTAQTTRVVGLPGDGYVEMGSPDLPTDGSISFFFRTQQPDGLLLLALGTRHDNFYSATLTHGRVSVWLNAGSGRMILTSKDRFNDGRPHSVSFIKQHRSVVLYIDEEEQATARMSRGASRINSMRHEQGGLYVGGLPVGVNASGRAASLLSLKGCIRDITINGILQLLDTAVDFNHADVGRCQAGALFPNLTDPTPDGTTTAKVPSFTVTITFPVTTPATTLSTTTTMPTTTTLPPTTTIKGNPTACAQSGFYRQDNDVVAFGDLKNSNAEVVVKRRAISRDFNVSLELRTFWEEGLVFFITNEIQSEFVAIQIRSGQIEVGYLDKNNDVMRRITSPQYVSDGNWHVLRVTKNRRLMRLRVDGGTITEDRITRKIDVIAPIYVGGLPSIYRPRDDMVSESFKGCMRGFELNEGSIDLFNSKAIMGVRTCYSDVEPGIHFDGYGFAIYAERYRIVSNFRVDLAFRTTQMNGILMSISHPSGNPALSLELFRGKLKLTALNSGGVFSVEAGECEHCLCDNKWHSATAELIKNVVTLSVDGGRVHVGTSTGNDETLNTNSELFIGGVPLYALPQGAVSTNEFFVGCMRNVRINKEPVSWHNMSSLIDVHVAACPVSLDQF